MTRKEITVRLVSTETDEFVLPLLSFIAPCSGRGLCGGPQVPAGEERPAGAGRRHQVQHGEIGLGVHDVRMLLWPGWSRLAPGPGRLVRRQLGITHSSRT